MSSSRQEGCQRPHLGHTTNPPHAPEATEMGVHDRSPCKGGLTFAGPVEEGGPSKAVKADPTQPGRSGWRAGPREPGPLGGTTAKFPARGQGRRLAGQARMTGRGQLPGQGAAQPGRQTAVCGGVGGPRPGCRGSAPDSRREASRPSCPFGKITGANTGSRGLQGTEDMALQSPMTTEALWPPHPTSEQKALSLRDPRTP